MAVIPNISMTQLWDMHIIIPLTEFQHCVKFQQQLQASLKFLHTEDPDDTADTAVTIIPQHFFSKNRRANKNSNNKNVVTYRFPKKNMLKLNVTELDNTRTSASLLIKMSLFAQQSGRYSVLS